MNVIIFYTFLTKCLKHSIYGIIIKNIPYSYKCNQNYAYLLENTYINISHLFI